MKTKRDTIIFYLPLSMDALTRDVSPVSGVPNIALNNSTQQNGIQNSSQKLDGVYWEKKKMYINPSQIRINENKNIKDTLTKGGYSIQYWGEVLTTLDISGTTGSSGVEGINVLYSIYRHEQLHFPKILEERDRRLAQEALDQSITGAQEAAVGQTSVAQALTIADTILTGGAISSTINGLASTISVFSDLVQNGGSEYTPAVAPTIPTLAAFATNIQMYHDGIFYRGYFTNFGFTENGDTPGLFDYSFNFKVTRKYGQRNNFMPWHRNPLDFSGNPQQSQGSNVSKGTYPGVNRLSFPLEPVESSKAWEQNDYDNFYRNDNSDDFFGVREQKSTFSETEDTTVNKSVSRRKLITG